MSDTAVTQGAHHIGLTVPDLAETRAFFLDTLGFSQVGKVPDYPAVFLTDGTTMITLWQAADPASAVAWLFRRSHAPAGRPCAGCLVNPAGFGTAGRQYSRRYSCTSQSVTA